MGSAAVAQDNLNLLESFVGGLLGKLDERGRRAASRDIGQVLRRSQQTRIAAQRNTDGSAYESRKPRVKPGGKKLREKRGRLKRAAMFTKLRTARYLKLQTDAAGLTVGFAGRVARVARVHQFGEIDRVAPHGVEYKYPVRELIGVTGEDREMIRDMLLKHITK
ncbi:phage virion morphogenesis protein [Burkholderia sp. Bp8986]|uniref:phage virion morphogenesis protein n=1 Tax=Burkholderia sp. Bp8986 TaxID=2184550 RepID=UPI000F59A492|nr:phage virion morphogenesis protein [Burkholderia sp. Bp8986]RQS60413.1 phage virion morphogenesis protein [Burkholderia sp. Bp8986]